MLIFNGHLSWICNTKVCYEELDVPEGMDIGYLWPDVERQAPERLNTLSDHSPALYTWSQLVASYQRRILSFETDVFNGFEGIHTVLKSGFRSGYFYGLPEMFFDIALLWLQPITRSIEQANRGKHNRRNHHFPSWSWAGWTGEFDTEFWDHCFDYVHGRHVDRVECADHANIILLVSWHKKAATSGLLTSIDNSYHVYHDKKGGSDSMPENWTFNETNNTYICKGSAEVMQENFRYPFPIQANHFPTIGEVSAPYTAYQPLLYFKAQKAPLDTVPAPESELLSSQSPPPVARIRDAQGHYIGKVVINFHDCTDSTMSFKHSQSPSPTRCYTFLAISYDKLKTPDPDRVPGVQGEQYIDGPEFESSYASDYCMIQASRP